MADDVKGTTHFSSVAAGEDISIVDDLTITDDLTVGGDAAVTGTLGATGAATLSSTLGVTGATTLASTLAVTGATTLSGATTLAANSTASKQLAVKTLLLSGLTSTKLGLYNFAYADGTNRMKFNSIQLYDLGTNALRTVYLHTGVLCVS